MVKGLFKNGQNWSKMDSQKETIVEFEELKAQKCDESPRYTEGYKFLLNEQPRLLCLPPKRPLSAIAGGCVTSLLPVFIDYKTDIESGFMAGLFVVGAFTFGYLATDTIIQIKGERQKKAVEIFNIETMRNWKSPIYVLPYDRSDTTVESRCIEIAKLLNDERCANPLHTALVGVEKKFSYTVQYGFRSGTVGQTEIGLPIISLFPSLFLLRGANDAQSWLAFQNEAVRIADEIDEAFAKYWHKEDAQSFKAVAGGQLMT
jgi:hypothetical protein